MRRVPATVHRRRKILLGAEEITDLVVDASTSVVDLSASSVVEGGSLTLTIYARNAAGQGLSGKTVTSVTVTPSTGITVSGSGTTGLGGLANRTITATTAGTGITVEVVVDGVTLLDVPTFDVTAAPTSGDIWDDIWADIWDDIWETV